MRSASAAFEASTSPMLLRLSIVPASGGTAFTLTYDNLSAFSYKSNGTESSSMSFGGVFACSLDFSVINSGGTYSPANFYGASIILSFGKATSGGLIEYVQMGIFKVDKAVTNDSDIDVSAVDRMHLLDVRFRGIEFPCTVHELITTICTQVNVTLVTSGYTNYGYSLDTSANVTGYTCRQILSLACEIAGAFAIFNSSGNLELRWFNPNVVNTSMSADFIEALDRHDSESIPSGVVGYLNEEVAVSGQETNPIYLSDDNVLTLNNMIDEYEVAVYNIYTERISGKTYTPCTVTARGNCLIEAGDTVQCTDKAGNVYKCIVGAIVLSDNLSMQISSTSPAGAQSTGGGGGSGGGGSSSSRFRTMYGAQLENKSLSTHETILASLQVTLTATNVPISMITSAVNCNSDCDVVFEIFAGSARLVEFIQHFKSGRNVFSASFPLMGIENGTSTVSLRSRTLSSVTGTWLSAGTTLVVMGEGFHASDTWDGLIEITENWSAASIAGQGFSVGVGSFTATPTESLINDAGIGSISGQITAASIDSYPNASVAVVGMTDSLTTE